MTRHERERRFWMFTVLGCSAVFLGLVLGARTIALSAAPGAGEDPAQAPAKASARAEPGRAPAPAAAPAPAQVPTRADTAPGQAPAMWKNSLGMEFVHIAPGEFHMGTTPAEVERLLKQFPDAKREDFSAEQPAHTVRISHPFEISKTKVTIGQFHVFVAATQYPADADADSRVGAKPRPWFPQADDHPMVNVSWKDVHAFCDWLSAQEKGRVRYRLPTEAEWEYACRAGTTTLFPNGDDPEKLALIGNVADASAHRRYPDWNWTIQADDGHVYASPVGVYAPNAWGLYDMIGNVWEWCEDHYDPGYYKTLKAPCVDPVGPAQGDARVIRGSCWFIPPRRCRPADRGGFAPGFRCSFLGFRLVAVRSE